MFKGVHLARPRDVSPSARPRACPDGKRSTDYRVTEVRCDLDVPEEALRVPGGKGWEVIAMDESQFGSWFARLFTIELVP